MLVLKLMHMLNVHHQTSSEDIHNIFNTCDNQLMFHNFQLFFTFIAFVVAESVSLLLTITSKYTQLRCCNICNICLQLNLIDKASF